MNTEIAEYIKNHIREYLPPEYQELYHSGRSDKRNDRRLTGLMIRNERRNYCPDNLFGTLCQAACAGAANG